MNQEEIVDNIILDMLELKHPSSKELILSGTTKSSRRLAMLSILDNKNRPLFNDYKNILINNPPHPCGEYSMDILQLLRKYVKVADIEVKEYGEVMTPLTLVNEMLDRLPKEVWSNPNLKWLDPCNGVGTFPSVIVERLMVGLKDVIKGDCNRYSHIIENMIYVCEIQPKNMFLFHCAFDRKDNHKLNTYCGSFLSDEFNEHMKNEWKIDKFDIVVANPPYNNKQNSKGKRGGGDTLWDKFVIKIINNSLKENGLLCCIHPTLWRKPQSINSSVKEVSKLMKSKQIHYLEMHSTDDGKKTFNSGTRYDFYVLENTPTYKTTEINDENRENISVMLNNIGFIPNKNINFTSILISSKDDLKLPIIFNRNNYGSDKKWVSDEQTDEYKYPLIHSTLKTHVRYKYSSRNDNGHFGIPKVIFGESGINEVIIDMNGEYGMTQGAMAIEVNTKEEAEDLKKCLMSENFKEFLSSNMWSNFRIDWRLFSYLKKDFYKQF